MSLDVLAGQSGLSKSFLSRVERGERQLERRGHLSAVSIALGCSIAELVGQPLPPVGAAQRQTLAALPAYRRALQGLALDYVEPGLTPMPIAELADRAAQVWDARRRCDYPTIARLLPGLLTDLQVHVAHGPDTPTALRLLVETTSGAAFNLRGIGMGDLGWTAAEQCVKAARSLGDPAAIGLAEYTHAHASILGPGYGGALHIAEQAADELRPRMGNDTEVQRVYGSLLLTAAWAATPLLDQDRSNYLDEAFALADRIGDAPPEGDQWQTYFGPSNCGIWQMSIAVESGDGGRVAEIADTVDLSVIDSKSRRAAYWTERGCGLAQDRATEPQAVAALLQADRIAPQRTRNNPHVRSTVANLVHYSRRRAIGSQLGRLASHMGVPAN